MEHRIELGEIRLGRWGGSALLLIVGVLVCLAGAFYAGAIETLGLETKRRAFHGYASSTSAGTSFGFKYFYFLEGQKFFADYDVEVNSGAFKIVVLQPFSNGREASHHRHVVVENGSGEAVFTIEKSGLYAIDFDGTVVGGDPNTRGYDVSYRVRWGVRQ
jgi:hypothetical protein